MHRSIVAVAPECKRIFTFQIEKGKVLQSELNDSCKARKSKQLLSFLHGKELAHEKRHARPLVYRCNDSLLPYQPRLRSGVRKTMSPWELVMGLVMAVGLTAYLVYAMLRPEKF
ncbi:MAG: K(+)-transporting ATPase subunit F [Candidatus Binataceae bacterium]